METNLILQKFSRETNIKYKNSKICNILESKEVPFIFKNKSIDLNNVFKNF